MKISLGSDHAGYLLKEEIRELLRSENHDVRDFGAFSEESVDYPDIARQVAAPVVSGECERGILVCGTGIGMCMTANKVPGIRAALCSEEYSAKLSIQHNNANILALGSRVTGSELAKEIVRVWLATTFDSSSRHAKRVDMIEPESV